MILHLITDDKFADYAINQFSSLSIPSEFVIVKESPDYTVKNIRNQKKVIQIHSDSNDFLVFKEKINMYDTVIIHGFFYPWQEELLKGISSQTKIAWVCWGGEIYGRKQLQYGFLKSSTKIVYWNKQFKRFLRRKPLLGNDYFPDISLYRKINFCLTDMEEEFLFVRKITNSEMKHMWYNYYSIEETLGELRQSKIIGNNIIVGNSCSLENNHLDVFKIIKNFNVGNRKIIVPLSYGVSWLRNIILDKGEKILGASFVPLIDFVDRNEYNNIISSCSIMIMPHLRPQAQGNIITGLWLGAKVYLYKDSMTFSYFRRIGVIVFSIEDDLLQTNKEALEPLSVEQIENNREVMLREYGMNTIKTRINEIVKELNKPE